jgi:hypothetical protein
MLARMWGEGTLQHCFWECKLVQPLCKTVCRSFKKQKTGLSYDPEISLLGIYLKKCAPGYNRATCKAMFVVVLFTIAKLWKQHRCPTFDEWIKKM